MMPYKIPPYVYAAHGGWMFRTEDEGEIGPYESESDVQRAFEAYCAAFLQWRERKPEIPK